MGFQGQLSSVNLTDIFQTLQMNRQTGTLSVTAPSEVLHIYFDGGQISICSAPRVDGMAFLLNALMRKNLLSAEQAQEINQRLYIGQLGLRGMLLASNLISEADLTEICSWCIEELVCPIFEWHEGDFTFIDGPPVAELKTLDVVAMGLGGLQTTQLILEATRRKDEWRRIRDVITDANALYIVDGEGRSNLRNIQTDPEMLKVLRYLDGRHTLDQIASTVGVTKFDTFAITAQLILAGIARPRTPEEIVADAAELRAAGELEQAQLLLENILRVANVPEVTRPLAEVCAELKQVPRAVELYLELIQYAQDQGDLEQARADLDTVIALSPDDPDLQFDRAKVLAELGTVEEAADAYVIAAQAYIATRDTGRALDACHRAKNLLPRSPDPHRFLAKAYCMDGQTENAVVEYKSLWHALLTAQQRPRRAIEMLNEILESDCRFNNVKQQVLSYVHNSDAVKTSKAVRFLVYILVAAVLLGVMVMGAIGVLQFVHQNDARKDLAIFKADLPDQLRQGAYANALDALRTLASKYASIGEIQQQVAALHEEILHDLETKADTDLVQAENAGPQAIAQLQSITERYQGTKAARDAEAEIARLKEEMVRNAVLADIDDAQRLWKELDWDRALTEIQTTSQRTDLSSALRVQVDGIVADWSQRIRSARDLYQRAQSLEESGRKPEAMLAYRRAGAGEGESYASMARQRLIILEHQVAEDMGQQALQAFERGDDKSAFAILDGIAALAKSASGRGPQDYLASFPLPCEISVDHPRTVLRIRQTHQGDRLVRAPAGTHGAWTCRLAYHVGDTVTVTAHRAGFKDETLAISADLRRSQATIQLVRGLLWQTDLNALPLTTPIAYERSVLVGTNRATIEVVDAALGISRPIAFPPTVDEFKAPPVVFRTCAYSVLDNRLTVSDIATHTPLWTYPADQGDSPLKLDGQVWVQEHELIPGQLLVFMGGAGTLYTFAVEDGRTIPYPSVSLPGEITGALVGDQFEPSHTVLYVPTGNVLTAFDTSSATEHTPPTALFSLPTRGEVIGRMAHGLVAGHPAMLAIDNSGLVLGLDANPGVANSQRTLGTWSLDGSGVGGVAVSPDQSAAYVATAEGHVQGLDLTHPGQLLWRFPAQGQVAMLGAAPAVGAAGIYVADAIGLLHCIDAHTGAERWHCDLGSTPSAGVLAAGGRVFIPLRNGQLACFEEGDD